MDSHICRGLIVAALAFRILFVSFRRRGRECCTAGAFKQVVLALVPDFENRPGTRSLSILTPQAVRRSG